MNSKLFYWWILLLLFVGSYSSYANAETTHLPSMIEKASHYLSSNGVNDDWGVIALSRVGKTIPSTYLEMKKEELTRLNGEFRRVTDYEKSVLGIVAIGSDPCNIAGYDLISKIANSDRLTAQGINGVIYALIALDSKDYAIPSGATWTREKLIQELLSQQNPDGGWPLFSEGKSDVDTTAMTLTALAPYQSQMKVKSAVQKAFTWLSSQQLATGGFIAWGSEACESASQVIVALCSWGIDPTSPQFTKEDGNVITNLYSFRQKNGSFAHTGKGEGNPMSTTQALQALVAYDFFLQGKGRFYHFRAMVKEAKPAKSVEKPQIIPAKKKVRVEKKVVSVFPKSKVITGSFAASSILTKKDRKVKIGTSFPSDQERIPKIDAAQPPSQSSNSAITSEDKRKERNAHVLKAWLPIGIGCAFVIWGLALKWYRRRGL